MKKSEFINRAVNGLLCSQAVALAEEAVRDALKRTGHPAVGPWDPEDLRPCPNPECVEDAGVALTRSETGWWVECGDCNMVGPYDSDEEEAVRLWDLLPRMQDEVPAKSPPEQPELPERLVALGDSLAVSGEATAKRPDWEAVTTEAAADYNFVRRVERRASEFPAFHAVSFHDLLAWLDEEREKLR